MTNVSSRLLAFLMTLSLMSLVASCGDSGHSLGNSTGAGGTPGNGGTSGTTSTGGAIGSGGAGTHASGGATSATGGTTTGTAGHGGAPGTGGSATGGASGGAAGGSSGGQGGTSTSNDAGSSDGDAGGTCGNVGDSCATRSCCGPLLCLSSTNPPSCFESIRPPADGGPIDGPLVLDTGCPVCPTMKCAYGSPVDDKGCTLCQCNPPPDGGGDTPNVCPLPEGCTDADPGTPCPSTPPPDGSTCTGQTVCSYESCPGTGHTQASCRSGKWAVSTGACGEVACLGVSTGTTCASGQVCLVKAGGALLVSCIDNPCAPGLVSADCSTVTAGCTPIFSTTGGLTYYCNTCPTGTCA
jgi:hypothetical protein